MGMREKLIELANEYFDSYPWYADIEDLNGEEMADHLIANGVTIPVRCKDCSFWHDFETHMDCRNPFGIGIPKPDDFCSYGKKRRDGYGNDD